MKKILIYTALLSSLLIGCNDNTLENTGNSTYENQAEIQEKIEVLDEEQDSEVLEETKADNSLEIENYLKNNSKSISDPNLLEEGLISMEDLDTHEIFLTGEVHGIKANFDLKMAFIKYFKEETNFKYLLSETSYSMSYFLNKYLETGDQTILEDIYSQMGNTSGYDKEGYEFWLKLYDYNQTLAEDSRIEVIGVDIDPHTMLAYKCLLDMLPDQEPPEEIKDSITSIADNLELMETSFQNRYKGEKNAEVLLENIDEHRDLYKDYLASNYVYFEMVVNNIIDSKLAYKFADDWVEWNNTRDRIIYGNFKTIDNELPPDIYYGQWGAGHVFQEENADVKWFAAYLNSYSKYEDRVLSIFYNYSDCQMKSENELREDFDFALPSIYQIKDQTESDFTLYKLNGREERPQIPMADIYSGSDLEIDVREYFQYIVLIKNSNATESYDKR